MKRFGIIGHPVAGSLSPSLFAAAYKGRYPYHLIDEEGFEEAWRRFLEDYDGVNVTAPFKQDAYARVDIPSGTARRCHAVNLVVKTPAGVAGYNTDVDGILQAVRPENPSEVLVVGAGGAARAAVAAAQELDCSVTVAGRTEAKVSALCREMGCQGTDLKGMAGVKPDLVIYTLPGNAPVPEGLPLRYAVVLEAEYKRPRLASLPCRKYLPGKLWLVHQALAGYQLFTGETPDAAAIWKTINT